MVSPLYNPGRGIIHVTLMPSRALLAKSHLYSKWSHRWGVRLILPNKETWPFLVQYGKYRWYNAGSTHPCCSCTSSFQVRCSWDPGWNHVYRLAETPGFCFLFVYFSARNGLNEDRPSYKLHICTLYVCFLFSLDRVVAGLIWRPGSPRLIGN